MLSIERFWNLDVSSKDKTVKISFTHVCYAPPIISKIHAGLGSSDISDLGGWYIISGMHIKIVL